MVLAFPGRRAQCPVHLGQVSIRIRMSNRSSIMDHSLSLSLSILSWAGVDGTKYTWSTFGCGWICSCPCSHSLSQAGSSPSPLHLRLSKFLSKVDCCFPRIPHSQDQEGAFDLSGGSEVPFEDDLGSGSLAGWKIGG